MPQVKKFFSEVFQNCPHQVQKFLPLPMLHILHPSSITFTAFNLVCHSNEVLEGGMISYADFIKLTELLSMENYIVHLYNTGIK